MTEHKHDLKRGVAHGRYVYDRGTVTPQIGWQLPAIGDRKLTPDEASEFADYLDEHADDEWLAFILLDERPAAVAAHLREEIERAERRADNFREAIDIENERQRTEREANDE